MARKSVKKTVAKKGRTKPPKNERELLCYGLHICSAIAKRRRSDVVRVYCTESTMGQFSDLLRWCASVKKAYHIVQNAEMERITGSVHHEGVAILVRMQAEGGLAELEQVIARYEEPLVYLDGVQNPHNIGTIMRVMAHFGWKSLVGSSSLPSLTAAAARMSEGGAEYVNIYRIGKVSDFWDLARKHGYKLYGSSSHAATSLYATDFPKKIVFVLGHEVHGMAKQNIALMDQNIFIPGTGQVGSLNVAVASGLLMGEYSRQNGILEPVQ